MVRATRMTSPSKTVSRKVVIGGAAVVIAVAGFAYWLRKEAIEGIYASVKPAPPAPIQPGQSSSRKRHTAPWGNRHTGLDWAFKVYRQMPAEEWQAIDGYMLAETLLREDRLALARAALEAARRIDGNHRKTIEGLEFLKRQQAAAPPRKRAELRDALTRIEPLQSVPSGPSLGLLVLGVAGYTRDRVHEVEFLDRLRARYNASLKRLHTPDDVVKIVARLLLETGRAAEARELLEPLLKPRDSGGPPPDPSALDREAAWLMSRAALQLGTDDIADEMLTLSGDFGKSVTAEVEPAPFVGSRRCAECHRAIYRAQQKENRHAQTLRFGTDLKDVPLPHEPIADAAVSGITHSFKRTSDREIEMRSQKDSQVFRAIVEYAVGSGRHGITMLGRDEEGIERELRVSYSGLDGTWRQTKGITFAPQQPGDHNGVALGQKEVNHCLSCHSTWFRSVAPDHGGARPPEGEDRGIGCERCHGPGLNHVRAAETGFAELAIMLGKKTPSRAQLNSCAECHSEDGTVPPSDPEFTRFQGTTFLYSRCFVANQDRFACTTCHDPHGALETDSTRYEAKCLGCHAPPPRPAPTAAVAAGGASAPSAAGGKVCPVNPAENCISCHMPKVEDPSRNARFTDHHIRPHRRDSQAQNRESSQRRVPIHGERLK